MKKVILFFALLVFILMSCQDNKTEQNNIALVEKLLTEGDNKNPSYLDEIADPTYNYYLPSNNAPLSLEEHKQFWESVNRSFPDLTHAVQEVFAVDDKVVVRAIVSGTHQEEFAGIAATGATVKISQILICRIENGKLMEIREEVDLLGLYNQLGMELQPKQQLDGAELSN